MSEPSDKLLNDYLAGASKLSRAYRASAADEPPAELDAAIKAAAHRAAGARPTLAQMPRRRAWFVPLSAAAVIVLASLLVLRVSQSPVGKEGNESKPDADVVARAPAHPPSIATAPVAEPAAPMQQTPFEAKAEIDSDEKSASSAGASGNSPAVERAKTAARGQASEERGAVARTPDKRPVTVAPRPAPVVAAPASSTDPSEDVALQRDDAFDSRLREQSVAARAGALAQGAAGVIAVEPNAQPSRREEAVAPVDVSPVPGVAAPDQAGHVTQSAQEQDNLPVTQEKERNVLADNPAERVAGASSASSAQQAGIPAKRTARTAAAKQNHAEGEDSALQGDPKKWIDKIIELQRDGKTQQVEQALRAFKQRYPQHALPLDLRKAWDALQAGADRTQSESP